MRNIFRLLSRSRRTSGETLAACRAATVAATSGSGGPVGTEQSRRAAVAWSKSSSGFCSLRSLIFQTSPDRCRGPRRTVGLQRLLQPGSSPVQEHADVVGREAEPLGCLLVAPALQANQAKQLGLLRLQIRKRFCQA